jgi:hypothetical protein
MRGLRMAGEGIETLAARVAGLGVGLISLRLFTMIISPTARAPRDEPALLWQWLGSSPMVQLCAIALVIGGSALWVVASLSKARAAQVRQC